MPRQNTSYAQKFVSRWDVCIFQLVKSNYLWNRIPSLTYWNEKYWDRYDSKQTQHNQTKSHDPAPSFVPHNVSGKKVANDTHKDNRDDKAHEPNAAKQENAGHAYKTCL